MDSPRIPPLLAKLLDRLEGQETLEVEFKAAQGGLPSSLWETVSAFANTNGGWILLGVSEGGDGSPMITGVPGASTQLRLFCDNVRNPQRISYPPCGAADTSIQTIDGKQVIVIRVRAAPLRNRPVYIKGNVYGGTYVRRHSGDYLCNKQEVDRMMREASSVAADSTILSHFGWDDLDAETLARYRRRFQNANPISPWNSYDDRHFLEAIGGYGRDRETGKEGITVAGLLLFGTGEAIRAWRSRHLIDYRLVPGEVDSDVRWEDRIAYEGNLLGAFESIYPRLTADLPRPFNLVEGRRVDDSPVHVALREALVNLLVHADYAETQASLIRRSPKEYYFRNPGSSRVPEVDLLAGDRSDPRNPALVRMFRLIGLAEEAGTGLAKIRQAWRQLGYRMPGIDVGTERYEFALSLHHAHLLSEDDRAWLEALGGGWSEPEQMALVVARHDGEVGNMRLRSLTGQHPADVTKVLGGLRDRGFLQMIGGGRGARYELGPATRIAPEAGDAAGRQLSLLETARWPTSSGVSSGDSRSSSEDKARSSEDKGPRSEDTEEKSEVTREELLEIAWPAREHRRLHPDKLGEVIVKLCARTPLSVRELAELVNRTESHLRETLRLLIAAGRLAYLYPDQPNHPHQRYTARPA